MSLGPKGKTDAIKHSELLEMIDDEGLAGFKPARALCDQETYEGHTEAARSLVKSGDFDGALSRLGEARSCNPDEDQLLLMAAIKDKRAQVKGKGELSAEDCATLLLSWQSYLSSCHRCKRTAVRHMNKAIKRANQLGARCGAWVSWSSEPSRARLFVGEYELGLTPSELWLPSGERPYSARLSDRVHKGTLKLKSGEEVSLNTSLAQVKEGEALQAYQIKAELLCDRPSSKEPLKRCAGTLQPGDRFKVRLSTEEDVFLYLMSVNKSSASVLIPSRRPLLLRRGSPTSLPAEDAYQLDDQSSSDAVIVMTSLKPIPKLLERPLQGEDKGWEQDLRSLLEGANSIKGDKHEARSDDQGWVMIKWDLRPPVKVPLKSGDQS